MWRPRFRIKNAFPQTSSILSLLASSWKMAALCLTTTSRRSPLSSWCCVSVVAANSFVLVSCWHISFPTLTICVIYFNQNCSKWFLPHNVYAYFLCGLRSMCTWIHESDAELICMRFFFLRRFNILCYASGFYMLLFFRQMFLMPPPAHARVCMCVCVCVCVCCSLALFSVIEHV